MFLLAVSVITSLLVSYGDELANIGSAAGKAAEKQKELGFIRQMYGIQAQPQV
mgnify:CR=1 FL=1